MNEIDQQHSAWDAPRPKNPPVASDAASPAATADTAPSSSPSSQSVSSTASAVDATARAAIDETHRLVVELEGQLEHQAALIERNTEVCKALADRITALEAHASDPANHNPPAPPAAPSSPAGA